mgnify:FL=1
MATKDQILSLLLSCRGSFLSGEELAQSLGVSRAAVWKGVKALKEAGFPIDAQQNRGYRLEAGLDILSAPGILGQLDKGHPYKIDLRPVVTSTNALLREQAALGAAEGTVLISGSQSQGRGRLGRSFFSPADTGVYLSVLLRPGLENPAGAVRLTTMAALAACEAVSEIAGQQAQIKWVNDVFLDGRKVAGILTEASVSLEDGSLDYVVLGVGFNLYAPADGFPAEIADTAGAILSAPLDNGKNALSAAFLNRFWALYRSPEGYEERYRQHCMVLGRDIWVISPRGQHPARALDLDKNCGLIIEYPDGTRQTLKAGEVRIREKKG